MTASPSATVVSFRRSSASRSVELFSGCGGLAMGLSLAGFSHELLVERNAQACATLDHNKTRETNLAKHWNVRSDDVRAIDWRVFADGLDLVAGGPPCQPFSIGGKAAGNEDDRDMWPEAVRAVRETLPKAFLFENVKGLLRPRFAQYVEWIAACLAHPMVVRARGETHASHLARLLADQKGALYHVQVVPVNAADYGAPQKRSRVLFIGLRKDICPAAPSFPAKTHSYERLIWDKWVSGEYWERHGLPRPDAAVMRTHETSALGKLRSQLFAPPGLPWVTCRDALLGLGEPGTRRDIPNHKFQSGARVYAGHTGSPIDEPAKALKAGVHGVPGGENMLLREDDTVRYFSVREASRLQGLPDDFEFPGSWSESMRQLGNAVPVQLSRFAGEWITQQISSATKHKRAA